MKCKSTLRRDVVPRRDQLSSDDIRRLSEAASSRFFSLSEVTAVQVIMFFVSFGSEVDTLPMIRRALAEGKRVAAPQADPATRRLTPREIRDPQKDLAPGAHNIREPKPCCPVVRPEEIDVVLCTTEEWREYLLWTTGIHPAYEIGATRAWGIDLHMRCCTTVTALKMAKDMMSTDPDINTVLIGGGYRIGDLISFKNLRTTFLFNIGAGAGAILLMAVVGAGIGYVWGTTCVRWGECDGRRL